MNDLIRVKLYLDAERIKGGFPIFVNKLYR